MRGFCASIDVSSRIPTGRTHAKILDPAPGRLHEPCLREGHTIRLRAARRTLRSTKTKYEDGTEVLSQNLKIHTASRAAYWYRLQRGARNVTS